MRRDTSDMESDFDEVFTDDANKGSSIQTNNGSQLVTRKRRRGIIEKRRRDRINNSLSELRRLVPAAFEKQGSAKLEKAEILQMTVDHLRILHSKGFDMYGFDPNKYVMDYHNIGFRECVSEIARYLVGMEGMDLQDPLRLRLMSHLQCYAAQRDLALKSSSPWSPGSHFGGLQPSEGATSHYEVQTSAHLTSRGSPLQTITTTTTSGTPPVNHYVGGVGYTTSANSYVSPSQPSSSVRPYRPWGTEMAY